MMVLIYPVVLGCTDPIAQNYNDLDGDDFADALTNVLSVDVNTDDGSCIAIDEGCAIEAACNFQENVINVMTLCEFPPVHYYCDTAGFGGDGYQFSCQNDVDGDGICDELEIEGCIASIFACNYNPNATDIVDCDIPPANYYCATTSDGYEFACINDLDGDGVCDELEIQRLY